MRRLALPLFAVAALVAGCNSSSNNHNTAGSQSQEGQQAAATAISGTVALRDQTVAVSPKAHLQLSLMDVTQQPSVSVAAKTIDPIGQVPRNFSLNFDPAKINANDIYVIQATIVDGDRHFTSPLQYPVLTKGSPAQVDIKLVAEATPSEKMLDAYKELKGQIGGMKISQGTALGDKASRAWQVFRKGGELQFAIERVDYDKAGYTETDYAYKDGKPWVVVQEKKADKNARPDSIERAGWDADGNLVLKQLESGGKTKPLSADNASSLHDQAEAMIKRAGGVKKGGK